MHLKYFHGFLQSVHKYRWAGWMNFYQSQTPLLFEVRNAYTVIVVVPFYCNELLYYYYSCSIYCRDSTISYYEPRSAMNSHQPPMFNLSTHVKILTCTILCVYCSFTYVYFIPKVQTYNKCLLRGLIMHQSLFYITKGRFFWTQNTFSTWTHSLILNPKW